MLEHEWDVKSVEFPLDKNSVVFDIGGYKGRWSREIAERFGARIFVFEPQAWVAKLAREDLIQFEGTRVFEFGLGVESGVFEMEEFETDGASFMLGRSKRQQSGEGRLVEISNWLYENNFGEIDLVMMNIEGYEFKLIPYMIEKGIMRRVKYFMCQFHLKDWTDEDAYFDIRRKLGEEMDVFWDYGQVLTCWARGERLSVVSGQQSAVSGQRSEVSSQRSAVSDQPAGEQIGKKPARKTRKKAAG